MTTKKKSLSLEQWMAENKMTLRDVAAALEISPQYVRLLMRKVQLPGRKTCIKIHELTRGAVPFESWTL